MAWTPPSSSSSLAVLPLFPGSGTSAIFGEELFNQRALVLLRYVQSSAPPTAAAAASSEDELQVEVLCALQVAVAKLNHPPSELRQ